MAFIAGGGYDKRARQLTPELRADVLAENEGLCRTCNRELATEVDHIDGSSPERSNLQGLCHDCHEAKTRTSFVSMDDAAMAIRDEFLARVLTDPPERECFDEETWEDRWPHYLSMNRDWCEAERGFIEGASFGDGSTGTEEDIEHGFYLQQLLERHD